MNRSKRVELQDEVKALRADILSLQTALREAREAVAAILSPPSSSRVDGRFTVSPSQFAKTMGVTAATVRGWISHRWTEGREYIDARSPGARRARFLIDPRLACVRAAEVATEVEESDAA